jgi:outer membrane immunogenic protein
MLRAAKSLGVLLLCASTAPAMANTSWLDGFYFGAGFGPEAQEFREDAAVAQIGNFFVKNHDYKSGRGMFGTIYAGYERYFPVQFTDCISWYLAGEINGNLSSASFESYNKEFVHKNYSNTDFRVQRSWGVSLLPGVLLTDTTTLYSRIGYSRGRFKVATTDVSLQSLEVGLNGIRYGVGIKHELTDNVSLRMEYSNVGYDDTSMFTLDTVSLTSKNTIITPQVAQVEFGLIFNF